jgi:hypothetical protein
MASDRRRAVANTPRSASRALDAHALYIEEVDRARAMSPGEKLLEGARLFDRACRLMADGIRHQHPDLDDDQVRAILVERLRRLCVIERQ